MKDHKYYCPKHSLKMAWEKSTIGGGGFDPVTLLTVSSKDQVKRKIVDFNHAIYKCPMRYCRSQVLVVEKSEITYVKE